MRDLRQRRGEQGELRGPVGEDGLPQGPAAALRDAQSWLREAGPEDIEKRLEEYKGKTPLNRFFVIEKDLDRFKGELTHLDRMIEKVEQCEKWKAEAFL